MTVVLDTIKRALRMVGECAEGETPSAAQAETALASLNGMVGTWENKGVRLALPALALTDTIPLPASHDDALAFGLAAVLATEYGRDLSQQQAMMAARTFAALQAVYAQVPTLVADPAFWRRRAGRVFT